MAEIVAHFETAGVPSTGLATAPTVTIYNAATGATVIAAANMTERGAGNFVYSFDTATGLLNYTIVADGDPLVAGQVDTRFVFGSLAGADLVQAYEGAIWVREGGFSGTGPVVGRDGTPAFPIDDDETALDELIAATGIRVIKIIEGSLAFTTSKVDLVFEGVGARFNLGVALGGVDISRSRFTNCNVSGTGASTGQVQFDHCFMVGVDVFAGQARWCDIVLSMRFSNGGTIFESTFSPFGAPCTLDPGTFGSNLWDITGNLQLIDQTDASATTNVSFKDNPLIDVAASCTLGTINIHGVAETARVTDNSVGATVNINVVPPSAAEIDTQLSGVHGPDSWEGQSNNPVVIGGSGISVVMGKQGLQTTLALDEEDGLSIVFGD